MTRLLIACALTIGIVNAVSCEDKVFDDAQLTAEDRMACTEYCEEARACDDELDLAACQNQCVDSLEDCFEDQVHDATDELRSCIDKDTCLDVTNCSFQVAADCFFGL
jgi:hypothetical protein